MARLTSKMHGQVIEHKAPRSNDATYILRDQMVKSARDSGYTLVGSAPGITMLVCDRHANGGLKATEDFCYIISVQTGKG